MYETKFYLRSAIQFISLGGEISLTTKSEYSGLKS